MIGPIMAVLGARGIIAAVAIMALPLAYAAGEWRESASTAAKVEAARLQIINELREQGHEQATEAVRAWRRAVDDHDRGRVRDDPNCRDC